LNSALAVMFA